MKDLIHTHRCRAYTPVFVYSYVTSTDMNSAQLIKRLESEGWIHVGGKGDHMKFKHPDKHGHGVVPHPRKDMPIRTLRNIYRQAGWDWR